MINLQELLALSTALSASLTAQIDFDSRQMKHCSTYNLAEGVDKDDGKARGIYQMDSEEYELAVTPKKTNRFFDVFGCVTRGCVKFRKHLETFVDHSIFQRTILFCILTNTFCMGIEFHR